MGPPSSTILLEVGGHLAEVAGPMEIWRKPPEHWKFGGSHENIENYRMSLECGCSSEGSGMPQVAGILLPRDTRAKIHWRATGSLEGSTSTMGSVSISKAGRLSAHSIDYSK